MESKIKIIVPQGMLGRSESDSALDMAMRKIAVATAKALNNDGWAEKYGVDFENDVFKIKPYCWCEQEKCPWCAYCTCPDSARKYFEDGVKITSKKYREAWNLVTQNDPFFKPGYPAVGTTKFRKLDQAYKKQINEFQQHYKVEFTPECDFCLGKGIFAVLGAEPGMGAPNFLYKPSKFGVRWYKYIGRGMESNRSISQKELNKIVTHCLKSLKKSKKQG